MAVDDSVDKSAEATLKKKVVSSLAWLSAAKALAQLVAWFVTFKVISILDPADYGLLALAMVTVGFLAVFNELGLAAAIIQRKDLTDELTQKIFGIVISVNMIMFLAAIAFAPLIASFFEDERLIDLIRVLALKFPLMSLSVIPTSLLARRMAFKKTAFIALCGQLVSSFLTLVLALEGYGVWSLVFGSLGALLVRIVMLNLACPFVKLPVFRLSGMGDVFSFSLTVLAGRVMFALFSQLDVLIAGKVLDKTSLGIYSVSVHIANMPMFKLMSIVNQVALPAYSIVQEDPQKVTYYFLKSVRLISVLSVAVLWGISAIAPEIVSLLLSEKWAAAQVPLQLVALVVPIRMISQMTSSMLTGCGLPRVALTNLMIICLVMGCALVVGSQWQATGMAWAWVVTFPFVTAIVVHRATKHLSHGLREVLRTLWKPLLAGAFMYGAVAGSRPIIAGIGLEGVSALALLVLIGGAVYLGSLSIAAPAALTELVNLLGLNRWFKRFKVRGV